MRYLIVKTSAFGDVVHTFPVLQFLHDMDPHATVDWVVEKNIAPLVKPLEQVNRVIEMDMKKWRKAPFSKVTRNELLAFRRELQRQEYDVAIDLQGNMKSAFVTFLAKAREKVGFGLKTASELLGPVVLTHRYNPPKGLNVRDENLFLVESHFKKSSLPPKEMRLQGTPKVALKDNSWLVCPHSNWPNKQLREETLLAFLESAHQTYKPCFIFLSGSDSEKAISERLKSHFNGAEVLHKPNFIELQEVMRQSKLILSMDSLPLHLAGTTETPTYSFFGPSSSNKYAPKGIAQGSFQGPCPYGRSFERRCPILRSCKTGACLRDVEAAALFTAFQNWFQT